jgi:hypothetical protein
VPRHQLVLRDVDNQLRLKEKVHLHVLALVPPLLALLGDALPPSGRGGGGCFFGEGREGLADDNDGVLGGIGVDLFEDTAASGGGGG